MFQSNKHNRGRISAFRMLLLMLFRNELSDVFLRRGTRFSSAPRVVLQQQQAQADYSTIRDNLQQSTSPVLSHTTYAICRENFLVMVYAKLLTHKGTKLWFNIPLQVS